jgi:hypothetical protein
MARNQEHTTEVEISPSVGELRTAADRLQLALESGEAAAVEAALDCIVVLGNAAALSLSR